MPVIGSVFDTPPCLLKEAPLGLLETAVQILDYTDELA